MHKLNRPTREPEQLAYARCNYSTWEQFPSGEKRFVQEELLLMQNFRCAYCECSLTEGEGHIEHFRRKHSRIHPELTFDWGNLFYSCMTKATCGRHKDKCYTEEFNYSLLINPCRDNPEDFLVFDFNGKVAVRDNLPDDERLKAETTICSFNLQDAMLTQKRKENLMKYKWLEKYPAMINEYLLSVCDQPFITSIYHYFGKKVFSEGM